MVQRVPINLGCGYGISIKLLVETLKSFVDFEEYYDTSKPSGFPLDYGHYFSKKLVG